MNPHDLNAPLLFETAPLTHQVVVQPMVELISHSAEFSPEFSPNRIFLIGLMGAGKSTVGRALAQRLDYTFLDIDHEIEKRTGASVPLIFELEGEAGFRKRETEMLHELTLHERVILATGGGSVLAQENRQALKNRGRVVFLRGQLQHLWQRVQRDRSRPMLHTANPRERLEQLSIEREPYYLDTAHYVVDTGRGSVGSMVEKILMQLESV